MTPDELRNALNSLTPSQLQAVNAAVGTGGGDESVEGRVQHFVYYPDRPKLEEVYVFRLKAIAGIHLETEADKIARATMESAAARGRPMRRHARPPPRNGPPLRRRTRRDTPRRRPARPGIRLSPPS